jgi:hypothetical protein
LILRLSSEVDCMRFEFLFFGASVLEAMLKKRSHGNIIAVAVLSLAYGLWSTSFSNVVSLATK